MYFFDEEKKPIEKVGLYIPGGSAPLFSTILMLAIPAQIAGCKEIVMCSPPTKEGSLPPEVLYTAKLCGVQNIYKVGGIQAIAAMALGTESISKVYKIFGPGNQYVTAAKQFALTQGLAIDMPAGPSELMVVADASADQSLEMGSNAIGTNGVSQIDASAAADSVATSKVSIDMSGATSAVDMTITTDSGDITPITKDITIPVGEKTATFTVNNEDNSSDELTETYSVEITNVSGGNYEKLVIGNSTVTTSIEDNKVIIIIKDNAQGISEEIMNKLFEPYITTKHQSQGIGLGLYITYNLVVEKMNGAIDIVNTVFILTILFSGKYTSLITRPCIVILFFETTCGRSFKSLLRF